MYRNNIYLTYMIKKNEYISNRYIELYMWEVEKIYVELWSEITVFFGVQTN